MRLRNIVVPIDLGPLSDDVLESAVVVARAFGGDITVVHVIRVNAPRAVLPPGVVGIPVAAETSVPAAELHSRLRVLMSRHLVPGVPMREQVETTTGPVSDSILRVAEEKQCDLIVMGTHGRSGVKRIVLGSVAEMVVRDACQPVFLIPARAASARHADNPQKELEV